MDGLTRIVSGATGARKPAVAGCIGADATGRASGGALSRDDNDMSPNVRVIVALPSTSRKATPGRWASPTAVQVE